MRFAQKSMKIVISAHLLPVKPGSHLCNKHKDECYTQAR